MILLLCTSVNSNAQYSRYIIELTDKQNSPYSIKNPIQFLSPESIQRKIRYNITLDSTDLPVTPSYLDSIRSAGAVTILNTSKWLNQVLIKTTDPAALVKISKWPFVKKTVPIAKRANSFIIPGVQSFTAKTNDISTATLSSSTVNVLNYGMNLPQIALHEGEYLHNKGFTGAGMKIAVLDAGFYRYQNITAFDSLRANGQILGTWDYVENGPSVNEDDSHGMMCLSIMAGNLPGTYIGTAPKARYYLFRTEDVASEYPVEEQNWAAAAEKADSLGVDLITSSLGYNQFDDASFNHVYSDMDGTKTIVSKAAAFAVSKGMIVTNSAGNEGAKAWKYIIAPADVENVLTVGAINVNKQVASFSSYGPAAGGKIKPDVTSVGWNTVLINTTGAVATGNGTSFSNPNMAGLVTCLWQAFPEFSNLEILDAIRKSTDHYTTPDVRTGYGIPNMRLAFNSLEAERFIRKASNILKNDFIKLYPNPVQKETTILYKGQVTGKLGIKITGMDGKFVRADSFDCKEGTYHYFTLSNLNVLSAGVYFLQYDDGVNKGMIRILK